MLDIDAAHLSVLRRTFSFLEYFRALSDLFEYGRRIQVTSSPVRNDTLVLRPIKSNVSHTRGIEPVISSLIIQFHVLLLKIFRRVLRFRGNLDK